MREWESPNNYILIIKHEKYVNNNRIIEFKTKLELDIKEIYLECFILID